SLPALLLIITGAICHALWNYFAKLASGGKPFVWLYGLTSAVLLLPLLLWALLFTDIDVSSNWPLLLFTALASAVLHIFYSLSLQHAYQNADMSVVYPIARGAGPLFAIIGAIFLLSERPSIIGWLGVGMIFMGILSISGIRRLLRKHDDARLKKGIHWGIITGLFIASYTLLDGWVVKIITLNIIMFYTTTLWIRTFMLAPFVLNDMPALKQQWKANRRYILLVGVLSPTAYLLTLYAMTMAPLSYVAPARELSMLFGAFIASYLLKEKGAKSRLLATLCIALGVGLLSFA
ncbi:MAG: EamA family transporter, partial [Saezia sp.]